MPWAHGAASTYEKLPPSTQPRNGRPGKAAHPRAPGGAVRAGASTSDTSTSRPSPGTAPHFGPPLQWDWMAPKPFLSGHLAAGSLRPVPPLRHLLSVMNPLGDDRHRGRTREVACGTFVLRLKR